MLSFEVFSFEYNAIAPFLQTAQLGGFVEWKLGSNWCQQYKWNKV